MPSIERHWWSGRGWRRQASAASLLLALGSTCIAAVDRDFYLDGDRRVPLQPSHEYRAISLAADDRDLVERLESSELFDRVELGGVGTTHGVALVRKREGVGDAAFRQAVARFNAESGRPGLPVWQSGEVTLMSLDRFTVRFADTVSTEAATRRLVTSLCAALAELCASGGMPGLRVDPDPRRKDRFTITFPANADWRSSLRAVNTLPGEPDIDAAYPDFIIVQPYSQEIRSMDRAERASAECPSPNQLADPNDTYFGGQWGLRNVGSNIAAGTVDADIDAPEGWAISKGSSDVVIAIVDVGVQLDHPDLQDKMIAGLATDGQSPGPKSAAFYHGTRVAGIAAAIPDNEKGIAGVAWHPKVMPVRIGVGDADALVFGPGEPAGTMIDAAASADVLVNSWNLYGRNAVIPGLGYAIGEIVRTQGRVVVFSAGNVRPWDCDDNQSNCWESTRYPATLEDVIAVSATDRNDHLKSIFSGPGDPLWGSAHSAEGEFTISLAAPGETLYTTDTNSGYACFDGTSAAAPLVGGAAALLKSRYPDAMPAQIRSWLQRGADEVPDQTGVPDRYFGYGRLNVAGAFAAAEEDLNAQPGRPEPPELIGR